MSQPSVARYGRGYDLDREFLDWFVAAYVGPGNSAAVPLASPVLHPVPTGLPATVILAAECDPLFDEARLYADKLSSAGIAVRLVEAPGMLHAFNELTHLIPAGAPYMAAAVAAARPFLAHP